MALQKVVKNGTETGATLADKINAIVDETNNSSSSITTLEAAVVDLPQLETDVANNTIAIDVNLTDTATNTSNIATNTSNIATNTSDLVSLKNVGVLSTYMSAPKTIPLLTTYEKIGITDTVGVNKPNGSVSHSFTLQQTTILKAGVYALSASGSIEGANGKIYNFAYFLNGIQINGATPVGYITTGAGAPVAVADTRFQTLAIADVLEVRAKTGVAGDLTIDSMHFSIEKTSY